MKRITVPALILFFTSFLYAQKDTAFYKHEVKASAGPSFATAFWLNEMCYANLSFTYLYRPVRWFWVGANLVNFVGDEISYHWREYYPNGSFRDFTKSKLKYCLAIAPEIRFSYLNRRSVVLYSALSAGIAIEDGYSTRKEKYPVILPYMQITYFGFSCNFGKNKNIFLGGEIGIGCKGVFNIQGGYRF
jgi:hypothetical protein